MPTETLAASRSRRARGAGGPRSCWPCWPARSSWAAWARSTSGASASSAPRPRRSTRSTTTTGWWPRSRASPAGEAAAAAVVDRRAHDSHRAPRRVDGPASRRGRRAWRRWLSSMPWGGGWEAGVGWPRPWSCVRWGSSSARCARPATTVRSRSSPRWLSTRPGADSTTGTTSRSRRSTAAPTRRTDSGRGRSGALVFYAALGLGFLTKGPVILLLVAVTVIPYLAFARRLAGACAGWSTAGVC